MGGDRAIGDLMELTGELQIRFTYLEEHLNVPALAVKSDDVFFRQAEVRGNKRDPFITLLPVPYVNKPRGKRDSFPVFLGVKNDFNGQKVAGFPPALPVLLENFSGRFLLSVYEILDFGCVDRLQLIEQKR